MHGENEKKKYCCEINKKNRVLSIKYKSENSNNRILLFEDKVILERKGELAGTLIFEKNRNTDFYYKTPYFERKFRCFTKEIEIKGNGFSAFYELYEGEDLINDIEISIKVEMK